LAATQIDLAAANRRAEAAERAALHDALTGAVNRRGIEAVHHHRAAGSLPYALVLLDLDRFKQVNDSLGHDIGDAVLVETATRLSGVTHGDDLVGRLGGDEFCVIAAGRTAEASQALAARVSAAMRAPIVIDASLTVRVTASVGLVYAQPGDPVAEVMHAADRALYRAKRAGRDGVAEHRRPLTSVSEVRPRERLRELRDAAFDGRDSWDRWDLVGAGRDVAGVIA
jgi:diguanylate cyclase (GGDEF)-like protein